MSSRFDHWPLGVNDEMDQHAVINGMGHWSCVSPNGNHWWGRQDGASTEYRGFDGGGKPVTYAEDLASFDEYHPMDQ